MPWGGWGFDEDDALKAKLEGFVLQNYASGNEMPIAVYFRWADTEIRQRTYPNILIDLIRVEFAADRAHRALSPIAPQQEMATPPSGSVLVADDFPLPWNMIYQLRTSSHGPREDRMFQVMMWHLFPEMYGSLNMANFDGTVRRADLIDFNRRDYMSADGKQRIYSQIFEISISSEFYLNQLTSVAQVSGVDVQFDSIGSDFSESFSIS